MTRYSSLLVPACLVLGFSLACGGSEGGVEVPNKMSADDRAHAARVLKAGEQVRAFYDATISLDGSEIAMVTDQRVVYVLDGNVTEIALADVTDVVRSEDALTGDIIDVKGVGGQRLRIEIAPLNDGPVFLEILKEATGK